MLQNISETALLLPYVDEIWNECHAGNTRSPRAGGGERAGFGSRSTRTAHAGEGVRDPTGFALAKGGKYESALLIFYDGCIRVCIQIKLVVTELELYALVFLMKSLTL